MFFSGFDFVCFKMSAGISSYSSDLSSEEMTSSSAIEITKLSRAHIPQNTEFSVPNRLFIYLPKIKK